MTDKAVQTAHMRRQDSSPGGVLVGSTFNCGWLFPENCRDSINLLTPNVGDGNSMTPEHKAFMVNVRKT